MTMFPRMDEMDMSQFMKEEDGKFQLEECIRVLINLGSY